MVTGRRYRRHRRRGQHGAAAGLQQERCGDAAEVSGGDPRVRAEHRQRGRPQRRRSAMRYERTEFYYAQD